MQCTSLLVLAAGMGSRYGGCKQIDPVGPNRETILDYSLYDAWKSGFTRAVLVIRRGMEDDLRERLQPRLQGRLALDFAFQDIDDLPAQVSPSTLTGREKPWGTGQAVWSARKTIEEPFATVNADDFYGRETFRIMADFLRRPKPGKAIPAYALAGYRLAATLSPHGTVSRGICRIEPTTGSLLRIDEQTGIFIGRQGQPAIAQTDGGERLLPPEAWASLNAWAFTPEVLPQLGERFEQFLGRHGSDPTAEFYLPTAVGDLIDSRACRVEVLPTPAAWRGVTYREDKPLLQEYIMELIRKGIYPNRLFD